jgi:hypothetical protein
MASRAFFDPEGSVPWLPAAFIAWLLDPPIDGAG